MQTQITPKKPDSFSKIEGFDEHESKELLSHYDHDVCAVGMTKEELDIHNTPEMRLQHQKDLEKIIHVLTKTKKSRQKFTDFFVCKDKCRQCLKAQEKNNTDLPCICHKISVNQFSALMVKYAFLTCVRSKDPTVRERSMTTFRSLVNIDDSEGGSDIKKMVEMTVEDYHKCLLKEGIGSKDNWIVSTFSNLLFSVVHVSHRYPSSIPIFSYS